MATPWLAITLMLALAGSGHFVAKGNVPLPLPTFPLVVPVRLPEATITAAGGRLALGPEVLLRTSQGDMVVVTFPEAAPQLVRHFLRTVAWGSFSSEGFWRVEPRDYLELGAPDTDLDPRMAARTWESNPLPKLPGALVMDRVPTDDGGISHRYAIITGPAGYYPGVVIGHVVAGMPIADRITGHDTLVGAVVLSPPNPAASGV